MARRERIREEAPAPEPVAPRKRGILFYVGVGTGLLLLNVMVIVAGILYGARSMPKTPVPTESEEVAVAERMDVVQGLDLARHRAAASIRAPSEIIVSELSHRPYRAVSAFFDEQPIFPEKKRELDRPMKPRHLNLATLGRSLIEVSAELVEAGRLGQAQDPVPPGIRQDPGTPGQRLAPESRTGEPRGMEATTREAEIRSPLTPTLDFVPVVEYNRAIIDPTYEPEPSGAHVASPSLKPIDEPGPVESEISRGP